MADVKKTIEIIFAGTDKVSGTIDTVSGNMSVFSDKVYAVAEPLSDVADNILKVNTALLALGAAGLTYAYIKSAEFESAVIELRKVLGDQPEALEEAKIAAFKLSEQYGESSATVLLSTANFKQAGFDIQESILLTKTAMDLSIAGSIESAEASELLVSTLKGFKAPATDATRLIDVLNEVSNNYATNVRELGIGMATLSPIANLMGFSFEETAGILTPVIEIFRSGTEASVALKMGLLRLIDDSKPVTDALAGIGVAQRDANGQLRSGRDILFDVAKAFETAEENDKLFLAAQLVGIRQAGKMVEVFDGLAKSTEITSVAMGAAGSAALEVALRLESAEIIVDRFKTGFANLAIVVGDQFLESAKVAISGGTDIENALQRVIKDGTFRPIFDALSDFSTDLGRYLSAIAEAIPEAFERVDFSGLLTAFGDLGDELKDFLGDLDLTDPEDLAKAIQFVVNSMESLVRVTKGMAEAFAPVLDGIIGAIKGFNDLDNASKESYGNLLGIAKAITSLGMTIGLILVTIGKHADVMEAIFKDAITVIGFAWDSVLITIEGILLFVSDAVQGLLRVMSYVTFGDLNKEIEGAVDSIQEFQDSLKEDIAGRAESNLDRLKYAFWIADDAVKETAKSIEEFPELVEIKVDVDAEKSLDELNKTLAEMGVLVKEKKPTTEIEVTPPVPARLREIKNEIEKEIPTEKMMEIKLKGEIDVEVARIKAEADKIQTAMEWTAKLDIAQVEAAAKVLEAAFGSVSVSIESTGETLVGLFGAFEGLTTKQRWMLEDEIKRESERRAKAFELQEKLTDAQIRSMDARTEAMERGEGLITIATDGLEPDLESFMWKIIDKVQIRASADEAEFLLGI